MAERGHAVTPDAFLKNILIPRGSDLPNASTNQRLVLVIAHPDDETIGAGALIARLHTWVDVVYVTDGAPRERRWWGAPDLPARENYAATRLQEAHIALELAGVGRQRVQCLGVVDQEASARLAPLARQLARHLADSCPQVVLTHAYEGGHPDHDATAFAVHNACRLLRKSGMPAPVIVEFTTYHAGAQGGFTAGEFLGESSEVVTIELTEPERQLKSRMLNAFETQQKTLASFGVEFERFRAAPDYNFLAPPHPGPLYYERFDWGCTGDEWCARAAHALAALQLEPLQC